jgi:uncharacterized glyoxalase superfamily protein PhnB
VALKRTVLEALRIFSVYSYISTSVSSETKRACEQIVQLHYSLDALQQRYNKAKKDNHKSFRYSLRLRIAVVDGMRNMYYDYAHKKAEVVAELRQELFGEVVDIVSDETDVEMY